MSIRALYSIMFKAKEGDMKTVKITIGNASANLYDWAGEIERLAEAAGVKNGIVWFSGTSSPRDYMPMSAAIVDGACAGKFNGSIASGNGTAGLRHINGTIRKVSLGTNWTADSRVGDEYTIAVVDCPWFE